MLDRLRWPLAGLALAGFIAALVVHLASIAGVDVQARLPSVFVLHVLGFAVLMPFVFASRRAFGPKISWRTVRDALPRPVFVAVAALSAYAFTNFFWGIHLTEGGNAAVRDGRYVLESHGHLLRTLSPDEFAQQRAAELRLFSGHWMVFYFVPFAFFAFARWPARDAASR